MDQLDLEQNLPSKPSKSFWENINPYPIDLISLSKEERDECGFKGHEWVCGDDAMMSARWMCKNLTDHMNTAFDKWTPRKRFTLYKA